MTFSISIPPDWQRASVSKYCHVQLGKMLQPDPSGDEDELLPYLRAISISKHGIDLSHQFAMWIKPHEKKKFRLERDDVLVSEGGDAGRTAYFDVDGEYYFQNAINRVRPLDGELIASRYLFYWFTFLKLAGYVDLVCNVATISHFTAEKVKAAPLAFPSLETQRLIAAFLDEKTAQIDGLIEKKRVLLDRLAENRQAVIIQAVTKGLNPAAPMKDSGIDWLGQIPAHWETFLIKRKYSVSYGVGGEIDRSLDAGTNLLSLPNISKDGRLMLEATQFTENEDASLLLQPGDLLFNWRNGSAEHLGKTALFDLKGKWTHVSFLLRIRAIEGNACTTFLRYFLNGMRETGFFASAKAGVNNTFNLFELQNLVVAAPPTKSEQESIADHIRSEVSNLDAASEILDASINRLTEYRSALITAAVTGQSEGLR